MADRRFVERVRAQAIERTVVPQEHKALVDDRSGRDVPRASTRCEQLSRRPGGARRARQSGRDGEVMSHFYPPPRLFPGPGLAVSKAIPTSRSDWWGRGLFLLWGEPQ